MLIKKTKSKIRIAIVDDHQIVIDGIVALLSGYEHIEIISTNISAQKMLSQLSALQLDVLLTDVMMPEMSGQAFALSASKISPEVRILALSMSSAPNIVHQMIEESNIAGYVLKNISKDELIEAIENVADGRLYFSSEVKKEMADWKKMNAQNEDSSLTQREKEIITLLEKELNSKQIAEQLFISERTVETHRKNIFRKTKTHSVLGLIKYSYLHRII